MMRFSGWLQALPHRLTPPPFRLVRIGSAFWQSRALYVAARLDIATCLGDDAQTSDVIASRVPADRAAVYRLLRFLASLGVFEECGPRTFKNNRVSEYLRADNPRNVRAMILMHNSDAMSLPWYTQLESGIRRGETPFKLAHGQDLFAYMSAHPDFDELFSAAMDSVESLTGESFAVDFDWSRFDRVFDIGGAKGSKAVAILRRHPHLKALVVDRAEVVRAGAEHRRGREDDAVLARLDFETGNVFGDLPRAASAKDIYLLAAVLHGFDDEACIRALQNLARAAAGTGAPIAVLEAVVEETKADLFGTSSDMQMFMGTRGRERTRGEWLALLDASGVVLEEEIRLRSFASILLLRAA